MVIIANRKNVITMAEQFRKAQCFVLGREASLEEQYGNEYIAISNEKLLDSDGDFFQLWARTAKEYWDAGDAKNLPIISTIDRLDSLGGGIVTWEINHLGIYYKMERVEMKTKDRTLIFVPEGFPEIVTLIGRTRFGDEFLEVQRKLGLEGKVVLSGSALRHSEGLNLTEEQKEKLDELYLRQIDLADTVYVIDFGGYIGEDTRREINYAELNDKRIMYSSKEKQ